MAMNPILFYETLRPISADLLKKPFCKQQNTRKIYLKRNQLRFVAEYCIYVQYLKKICIVVFWKYIRYILI